MPFLYEGDRERLTDMLTPLNRIFGKTINGRAAGFGYCIISRSSVKRQGPYLRRSEDCTPIQFGYKPLEYGIFQCATHFNIDANQIWEFVEQDLQPLRDRVASILASSGSEEK
jgi:hypothetical protein